MARSLRRHPLVLDWLPVVVIAPVLILDAALSVQGEPLTPLSVPAAFVGCLPLVARRRVGFGVLVVPMVGGIVLVLWALKPANTVVLIPMTALVELALRGDRRRSLWMALITVPCVIVCVVPFGGSAAHLAGIIVRNAALCLLAIAVGDVMRSRQETARRALQASEQETLRRVADERLRIAHEIHDTIAHAMTAINVQAGVAAHLIDRDRSQAHGALRDIKRTSGEALVELRATLDVLRDPDRAAPLHPSGALHDLGPLADGLRAAGVVVTLEVTGVEALGTAVHGAGYRIVQEALTNVARHARAQRASVSVRRENGAVLIDVCDDGAGAARVPEGNGLRGMRERASALGGTVHCAPAPDGGWQVRARLPAGGEGEA